MKCTRRVFPSTAYRRSPIARPAIASALSTMTFAA
jgi:hypothetical protein